MKKTIIAVILCLGLLVVFGAAAVGGEPAETGKKGSAVSYAEQDGIQAGGVTLGLDKGQAMAALIETVFGYDLRSYAYVSFAELWNGEPSTEALRAIRGILTDTCAGMEAGERMPVGYLYQGQAVYTVVEQPDGSLKLTNYELQPAYSAGGLGKPSFQTIRWSARSSARQSPMRSLYSIHNGSEKNAFP